MMQVVLNKLSKIILILLLFFIEFDMPIQWKKLILEIKVVISFGKI